MSEAVTHNEGARRFEVTVDGHTGFLQYARGGNRIELLHTEVPSALGGRGLGAQLAKAAFEHAGASELRVTVTCPYVRKYLEKHPEYAGLLSQD